MAPGVGYGPEKKARGSLVVAFQQLAFRRCPTLYSVSEKHVKGPSMLYICLSVSRFSYVSLTLGAPSPT